MTTNKQYKVRIIVITTIVSVLILAIGGYFVYLDMQKQPSKKSIVDTATAEKYPENVKQNVTPTKEKDDILDADKISEEDLDAQELEQILSLELLGSKELEDVQRKIFKENSKAVVVVTAYDENGNAINQGSGFIVRRDGAVVTNYHVISKARSIKVKAGDKVFDVEGLIFTDKENDLVILKARAKNMPVVKLGVIEKANIGEHIYVISSPVGLENTISDGLLSGIREIDEKREVLQITAPVSPGSSGGPVFNINGEAIGVVTFLIQEAQNLNFAMPVELIKDKISSKSVTEIKGSGIEDYEMTPEHWFNLGNAYYDSGKYKEAIKSFKQALRINPDDAEAHFNLGVAYGGLGKYKEAIESYKQAIRIDPDCRDAHYNLGVAYYESGRHQEAIESYKHTIRIDPDCKSAHYNLGLTYGKLGKREEAIEACKQAIRINPDDAKALSFLGTCYVFLDKHKEAIDAYEQAIRIDPDYAVAHSGLGLVYNFIGKHNEAIKALKQAIRFNPDYADTHNNLGLAYYNTGRYKEAIESYKQAIKVDPDFALAHNGLGIAYGYLGKYEEAIESYKQAIRIDPDDATAHYGLGVTYIILRDKSSALKQHKILKKLDTKMAKELLGMIYTELD